MFDASTFLGSGYPHSLNMTATAVLGRSQELRSPRTPTSLKAVSIQDEACPQEADRAACIADSGIQPDG